MKTFITALALAVTTLAATAADVTLADEQVAAAFKKADRDGNGTLSEAEAARFGIAKKWFLAANPDKDGSLDPKEFAAAIGLQFKAANPDNDGTLDAKEARVAGIKSKKVFEAANPDKDGTLDLAEYLAALVAQAK